MSVRRPEAIDRTKADWSDRPDHFGGKVGRLELGTTAEGVQVLAVFFDAGARTLPHIHMSDQVLQCIDGEGIVSVDVPDQGRPKVVRIKALDTIRIPMGTWHWHGAIRKSPMTHLSILVHDDRDRWEGVEKKDWEAYREE
jgi:quercetin dioxygenase-like cupin family protein